MKTWATGLHKIYSHNFLLKIIYGTGTENGAVLIMNTLSILPRGPDLLLEFGIYLVKEECCVTT
jgi:hypothetical protein